MYTSYIDPALQGYKGNVNIAGGYPFTNQWNTQAYGYNKPVWTGTEHLGTQFGGLNSLPFANTINPYLTQGLGIHQPMINTINPYLTQGLGVQQPIIPGMIPQSLYGAGLGHVHPLWAQGINPFVGRPGFPYANQLAFGGVDPRFSPLATQGLFDANLIAQKEALLREVQKLQALNCCTPYDVLGFGAPVVRVI